MIRFSNQVTGWVATEILRPEDIRQRAVALNRFLAMAKSSIKINNFNGAMEILSALNSAPVHRLQRTWNMLPHKSWEWFEELTSLFNTSINWKAYREKLKSATPPCVPYLGLYLSDLTFIEGHS